MNIEYLLSNNLITLNKHPDDSELVIINYTPEVVYSRAWTSDLLAARGLIMRGEKIVSKPFDKFFNLGENPEYEIEIGNPVEVLEKMDGSLGISYPLNGETFFATRGSFTSEQAVKATQMWREKYGGHHVEGLTLLVEIIYPENRIVVDYGDSEMLVLIGAITDDGYDLPYVELQGLASLYNLPIAKRYTDLSVADLVELREKIPYNEEGWIIRYDSGKRLKVKGERYLELHRIMFGLSDKAKRTAWFEGATEDMIRSVPEEFRVELESFFNELDEKYEKLMVEVTQKFNQIKHIKPRKNFAVEALKTPVPSALFALLDGDENKAARSIKSHVISTGEGD